MANRAGNNNNASLELGMLQALRTGDATLDLFVVALLPTLVALVAASSEGARDVARRAICGRRTARYDRVVRVERRQTRWGDGDNVDGEERNEVLQKAIAFHLARLGALDGVDDAKLRLMARGGVEKGEGTYSWDKKFGTSTALLGQYEVVPAVPDGVWTRVPGAPGGLKVIREVDEDRDREGDDDGKKDGDSSTKWTDFRISCDERAPIDAFLTAAFDNYVAATAASEDSGRYLYVRAPSPATTTAEDDDGGGSSNPTYKRYKLAAHKTFDSLFFPEKDELLSLLDSFHAGTGRFAVRGSPKKLGLLLHGPPGTGKTSLIKALAARLGRNVVSIPLGRIKTNQELMDAVFDLKFEVEDLDVPARLSFKQCVFVLEDVDAASRVVHKREGGATAAVEAAAPTAAYAPPADPLQALLECIAMADDKAHGPQWSTLAASSKAVSDRLDLSGILNVLDGVVDTPERILVLTTNHPESLDPALVRPGRVDVRLELGFVAYDAAKQIVEHYVLRRPATRDEADAFRDAWNRRATKHVTPAELEQICAACDALDDVCAALVAGAETSWAREPTTM